jgi:hypothetical protein
MHKPIAQFAGSVAVMCLLSAPAFAQYVYSVPPIPFAQAQPITGSTPVDIGDPFYKPVVRTPTGAVVGVFLRAELHDGQRPVGIVTLKDYNKTVAVPLERLRFNPAGREVLTDLSWEQVATMPSGVRLRDSRCYPYGCPSGEGTTTATAAAQR